MNPTDPQLKQMSMEERMPESSREARSALGQIIRDERILNRKRVYRILAPGTPARTDVHGFRFHDLRVVEDRGPEGAYDRKVKLKKIDGKREGEIVSVRRDRVRLVPGH